MTARATASARSEVATFVPVKVMVRVPAVSVKVAKTVPFVSSRSLPETVKEEASKPNVSLASAPPWRARVSVAPA